MHELEKALTAINQQITTRKKRQSKFPNFICSIRFPVYKNLESNSFINFDFPLTVLVGQNGCGKSSVLHALEGSPSGKSVGKFWFSTKLDPIQEGRGKPNCFIYKYYNAKAGKEVEVIKQRVRYKKKVGDTIKINPDYWEPTRSSIEYDMIPPIVKKEKPEPGGHKSSRWQVPKFKVVYINFRSELSAFDQYFYFGEKPQNLKRYSSKQDRLRSWVKNRLSPLLEGEKDYVLTRNKKKLNKKPVKKLPVAEVAIISNILGKDYIECKMLEHQCFGTLGYSVQFVVNDMTYTEAFAGSGEMSVVRVVHSVAQAPVNSLILLDEPEVSLHPGAQKKLKTFLLQQCADYGHQIVISSHSPTILEDLPDKAIKVFTSSQHGKFRIDNERCRNDAFVQIGQTVSEKKQIIVEDNIAKYLVEHALESLGNEFVQTFEVNYYPGGESSIFKDLVLYSRKSEKDLFVIFDGDIYVEDWPNQEDVAASDLDETIEKYCDQKVKNLNFRFDGGSSDQQKAEVKRAFLKYLSERCFYFPTLIPEELIWGACTINDKYSYENGPDQSEKNRFKTYLGKYVKDQTGSDTSSDRVVIVKQILRKQFDDSNSDYGKLLDILRKIKSS